MTDIDMLGRRWDDMPGQYPTRQAATTAAGAVPGHTRVISRELRPGTARYIVQALDVRQVLRGDGCQHPGLSDEQVLLHHDAMAGYQPTLTCKAVRTRGERSWVCGDWYTVETRDGDVRLVDEPPGAGL